MKTTKTITVTTTTTEEIDIEFPIYLKESGSCIYALFSPDEIYEVNMYDGISRGHISKCIISGENIYANCKGATVTEAEFVDHWVKAKTYINNTMSEFNNAFNCRNEVEDNHQDATDGKDLNYDRLEYEAIQKAEVDR